jgi:hypothetical protein
LVSKSSSSEKHRQNCCADHSNAFHGCCLCISLRAVGMLNCLLLTNQGRMPSFCARAA